MAHNIHIGCEALFILFSVDNNMQLVFPGVACFMYMSLYVVCLLPFILNIRPPAS